MRSLIDRLGDYLDALEAARSAPAIGAAFFEELRRLEFASFWMLSAMIDPIDPAARGVVLSSVDVGSWFERYSERGYQLIDPIREAAALRGHPFYWRDDEFRRDLTPSQLEMLDDLSAHGWSEGLAIPIKTLGRPPAHCAVFSADGATGSLKAAHSLAIFTHDRAWALLDAQSPSSSPRPTARERACLLLAGRGKSDKEIAQLLGLSERTIHHSIERAKRRLGVPTRMQAVIRAVHDGEIMTDELVG